MYLVAYNTIQLLGWFSLLIRTLCYLPSHFYEVHSIELHIKIVQTLMALEILHSILKISPSPTVPTTLQIFSRLWSVYGVMDIVKTSPWVYSAVLMWSIAETIRYSNYLYLEFCIPLKTMTWIRYSGFLILYPIGISSELLSLFDALPHIQKCCPRVFSFEMPNPYNISFDYLYFIYGAIIPAYIMGSPFLFTYMLSQRKKKLSKTE